MAKITLFALVYFLFFYSSAFASFRCNHVNLRINTDTESNIMAKCGEPAAILKTETIKERRSRNKYNMEHQEKMIDVYEWTYYCSQREWKLTFTGGILTGIQQGPFIRGDVQRSICGNGIWD